ILFFLSGFLFLGMLFPREGYCYQERYPFQGNIDLETGQIIMSLQLNDESSVAVNIKEVLKNTVHVTLSLEKLKTPVFDISSAIESSVEYGLGGKGNVSLIGKLWSNYTLVNYKPIQELSGRYEITEQSLKLVDISFGTVTCNGTIDFVKPYKMDLLFDIHEMAMSDFLKFWMPYKEYDADGIVSGSVRAFGSVGNMTLRGSLDTSGGYVERLNFDRIHLNASGIYPNIEIAQSTISQTGGMSFNLEGNLDFSDKVNFKKQLKDLNLSPLTSESDLQSEWTIKRVEDAEVTTEFKYLIRDDETDASTNKEEGILGIERKMEF
ncbi:MAG: hypothetical protein KC684_09900, partial [Candidatus Omnitrophica bacterium]|nr:hypothetical protein [Candidatus Omnitrophota bacterium]